MTEREQIKVTPAKGRPMLTWVGKRPLSQVTAFPAQHVETFDPTGDAARRGTDRDAWAGWPDRYPRGGLLFHGDNKEVLAHLLANGFRGKVKLIYIDPPFDSGADYVRRVRLRGATGRTQIDGEGYTLGEQIQYQDIWANDNYLQFMYERLILLRELLSENGTLYLHCDDTKAHLLRCLLDEVFGPDNFMNEVIWIFRERGISTAAWNRKHNNIFVYAKRLGQQTFNVDPVREEYSEETKRKFKYKDDIGYYQIRGRNIPGSPIRQADGLRPEHEEAYPGLTYRQYMQHGQLPVDWWEIPPINKAARERTSYPTQKPKELLYKIILASSEARAVVLDCFAGSGTAAEVAQETGRRWIACDINKGAIQTASARLQAVIQEQIAAQDKNAQGRLVETDEEPPPPAQLSFTVWRVNDYDLQIQHNEAVNLACEHIGIQRTHTDPFFDGTLGRNLAKIVPFNHPLSQLDLDEIRRELQARPEEDRTITAVCLGMELAAQAWIEDWNRLRKGEKAVNRIEVIELRTDPRYGKFFEHKPDSAKVSVARQDGQIHVKIEGFISPTIIERLTQQVGVVKPQIEDWRGMVDCVMIDPAFDGEVFKVALSDVPAKKDDLVEGRYTLPAPDLPTTVAVKIIDMLGEEVLVTERV